MSGRPSVSAVVIYHNSPQTIGRVLQALLQQDHALDAIVVVDNGSEQAPDIPAEGASRVHTIRLPHNAGLARARNLGVASVQSEYVLILDDDVYPAAACLGTMLSAAVATGAAAVCPRILLHPGDRVVQCDGATIHFAGMLALNHKDADVDDVPAVRSTSGAFIGACNLLQRQALVDLGGFDEDYFFYFEDMELSYRLSSRGLKILCEPTAVVLHDRGAGTPGLSFRGSGEYPSQRAYYTLRNRWLTIALHYEWRTLFLLAPACALYELAALAECIRRGWAWQWLRASTSILRHCASILRRRNRIQRLRTVSDAAILTGGALPFATGFAGSASSAAATRFLDHALNQWWSLASKWMR